MTGLVHTRPLAVARRFPGDGCHAPLCARAGHIGFSEVEPFAVAPVTG